MPRLPHPHNFFCRPRKFAPHMIHPRIKSASLHDRLEIGRTNRNNDGIEPMPHQDAHGGNDKPLVPEDRTQSRRVPLPVYDEQIHNKLPYGRKPVTRRCSNSRRTKNPRTMDMIVKIAPIRMLVENAT